MYWKIATLNDFEIIHVPVDVILGMPLVAWFLDIRRTSIQPCGLLTRMGMDTTVSLFAS